MEQELRLSYYRHAADLRSDHGVTLVQDVRSGKLYVKKELTVYNAGIYRFLRDNPVAGTPRVYLCEESEGVLTVIEEYIHGDTLEELLEREGPMAPARAAGIVLELCDILARFHACEPPIVNRDIKPSNIMLTADGRVRLLDHNAARRCDGSGTRDTTLLGTHGYAAPEQYGFGQSGVAADIYSAGVLLNVLVTGELPDRRRAEGETGKIVARCTRLEPSGRYGSAEELKTALARLAGKRETPQGRRRYLPPGFRGNSPVTWLLAALGYISLVSICSGMVVENAGMAETVLNRITLFAALLSIVFFNGNYLDVQQSFILTRSPHRWVRWLGMALVDSAIILLWIIILDFLVRIFVR